MDNCFTSVTTVPSFADGVQADAGGRFFDNFRGCCDSVVKGFEAFVGVGASRVVMVAEGVWELLKEAWMLQGPSSDAFKARFIG